MGNERFIFWFWESPTINRLTCMQGQKTLSLSYMHLFFTLFAQRLPNDSFNYSFFQTPPLRDANLWWLVDWSHFHLISPVMPDKAVFVSSAVLCTVLPGKQIFLLQKWHLVAKNEFAFSFRPMQKTNKWAAIC